MRLLLCCFASVVLAAGLAPSVSVAQGVPTASVETIEAPEGWCAESNTDTPFMLVKDVRPGMRGFGCMTFQGTEPEAFGFTVLEVLPNYQGWPKAIIVELSGGPKLEGGVPFFTRHQQIFNGMSGSPMDVLDVATGERRRIGGLVRAPGFQTTAKAIVTPIEYQLNMANVLEGVSLKPSHPTVRPGQFVSVCPAYGYRDWCVSAMVTDRRNGLLYAYSHHISFSDKEWVDYGRVNLQVFLAPVAQRMESLENSVLLPGARIAPIGTALVHGKFGFVINQGEQSRSAPVRLEVSDTKTGFTADFQMNYYRDIPDRLMELLGESIMDIPVDRPNLARLEVRIDLEHPSGVIRFVDAVDTALPSLEALLRSLIKQEEDALHINVVTITYHRLMENDIWVPSVIAVDRKGDKGAVIVTAQRQRDQENMRFTLMTDLRPIARKDSKPLYWTDGTYAQAELIKLMPVRMALPLLAQIEEREALYLLGTSSRDVRRNENVTRDSATQLIPSVKILIKSTDGTRFFLALADKGKRTLPFTRQQ